MRKYGADGSALRSGVARLREAESVGRGVGAVKRFAKGPAPAGGDGLRGGDWVQDEVGFVLWCGLMLDLWASSS